MTGDYLKRALETQAKSASISLARARAYRFGLIEIVQRIKFELEILHMAAEDPEVGAVIIVLEHRLKKYERELTALEHDVIEPMEARRFTIDAQRRRCDRLQQTLFA